MKINKSFKYTAAIIVTMLVSACEKPNELPPHNEAYIIQYLPPEPVFLTSEERDLVNQQREEYNKL